MSINKDQLVKNATEIAKAMVKEAGIEDLRVTQKLTGLFVEATVQAVADSLANGEEVKIVNFGTFEIRDRAGRMGRNPKTGEALEIAPSRNVGFKASKNLKEMLPQA